MQEEDLSRWYQHLYKRGGVWWCDFTYPGCDRCRRSLKTRDRDEAARRVRDTWLILEHKARQTELLAAGVITKDQAKHRVEITLERALAWYMDEHGDKLPSAVTLRGYDVLITNILGADTLLSAVDGPMVHKLVRELEKRKVHYASGDRPIAESTINGHVKHLRAVMRRARKRWGVECAPDLIEWGEIMLVEPDHKRVVLDDPERERAVYDALDRDTRDIFTFSLITGVRASNAYGLKKPQVNWAQGRIEIWVKSRKRSRQRGGASGKLKIIPITAEIEAILRRNWDKHASYVFTYVCRRTFVQVPRGSTQRNRLRKGERYPFTESTLRQRWLEARARAGMPDLKWHGLRATFATERNKEGVDLKTIQELMGHADISTTLRYIVASEARQREALEHAAKLRAERAKGQGRYSANVREPKSKQQ